MNKKSRYLETGKGDLLLRLVRAERNRSLGGIHGPDAQREQEELKLLLAALNREVVRVPLECEDEAPKPSDLDFDTICDTSCCRVQPKSSRRKSKLI